MKSYALIWDRVLSAIWGCEPETVQAIVNAVRDHSQRLIIAGRNEMAMAGNDDEDEEEVMCSDAGLAIIPVYGIIGKHLSSMEMACGGCSLDMVCSMLDACDRSDDVSKILLDFNSPGGEATGVKEAYEKIRDINTRKNVFGFTDSRCCSAAYWLAAACEEVYCTSSARVGSIGVYSLFLDESRRIENEGDKVNAIVSGKFKLAGAPFKPLTDEERGMLQARVDKIGAAFRASIVATRPYVKPEDMDGQVFDGDEAVSKGFAAGITDRKECISGLIS